MEKKVRFDCAVDRVMSVIGGKWKSTIICLLLQKGKLRFSQLKRGIPPISSRILSKQLKELVEDGVVIREVIRESPVHVEYSLTEKGMSLSTVLRCMAEWGLANLFDPIIEIEDTT